MDWMHSWITSKRELEILESYVCLKDAATLTMFLDARSKDFVALLLFDKTEEAMLN
jgi:hypothetical protein